MLEREHFRDSDHNSVGFTVIMERNKVSSDINAQKWDKANFIIIRQDLAKAI